MPLHTRVELRTRLNIHVETDHDVYVARPCKLPDDELGCTLGHDVELRDEGLHGVPQRDVEQHRYRGLGKQRDGVLHDRRNLGDEGLRGVELHGVRELRDVELDGEVLHDVPRNPGNVVQQHGGHRHDHRSLQDEELREQEVRRRSDCRHQSLWR